MAYENILREDREGVAFVTVNRPDKLNALNNATIGELLHCFEALSLDEQVRAVILTGSGEKAFVAGADISELAQQTSITARPLALRGQRLMNTVEACPKPVIAAVNGYALGGGLELALACDLRVATAAAKLGQPEITLANLPGWGGTQRLPRLVGEGAAKDLILTGRLVDAAEAHALGLVQRVVEGSALDAALELARELAGRAPAAVAGAKAAIHAARRAGDDGYLVERQAVALCFTTEEQQAAVRDFLSRRGTRKEERRTT